jgi:hypothetical protein
MNDQAEQDAMSRLLITDPQGLIDQLTALWDTGPLYGLLEEERPHPLCQRDERYLAPAKDQGFDNPLWDIVRLMPEDNLGGWGGGPRINEYVRRQPGGSPMGLPEKARRSNLTYTFAWAIPSPGDILFLATCLAGRPVIEIGAGTGYWAWQMSQALIDVVAFDSFEWREGNRMSAIQYHPVHQGSIEQIPLHPNRVLMLCWPTYDDPFAADALDAYQGDTLIYVGEPSGGCTGDDRFDEMLSRYWEGTHRSPFHINHMGINSDVGVYRRRETPLPKEDRAW